MITLKQNRLILLVAGFLFVAGLSVATLFVLKQEVDPNVVVKVGTVKITKTQVAELAKATATTEEVAKDALVEKEVIEQAAKENKLTIDESLYKEILAASAVPEAEMYTSRYTYQRVGFLKDHIGPKITGYVEGHWLSFNYFEHNPDFFNPDFDGYQHASRPGHEARLKQQKDKAYAMATDLQKRLKEKTITPEQAQKIIDTDLLLGEKSYYQSFERGEHIDIKAKLDKLGIYHPRRVELLKKVMGQKEGSVSDIMIDSWDIQGQKGVTRQERGYVLVVVDKKHNAISGNFEEWLKKEQAKRVKTSGKTKLLDNVKKSVNNEALATHPPGCQQPTSDGPQTAPPHNWGTTESGGANGLTALAVRLEYGSGFSSNTGNGVEGEGITLATFNEQNIPNDGNGSDDDKEYPIRYLRHNSDTVRIDRDSNNNNKGINSLVFATGGSATTAGQYVGRYSCSFVNGKSYSDYRGPGSVSSNSVRRAHGWVNLGDGTVNNEGNLLLLDCTFSRADNTIVAHDYYIDLPSTVGGSSGYWEVKTRSGGYRTGSAPAVNGSRVTFQINNDVALYMVLVFNKNPDYHISDLKFKNGAGSVVTSVAAGATVKVEATVKNKATGGAATAASFTNICVNHSDTTNCLKGGALVTSGNLTRQSTTALASNSTEIETRDSWTVPAVAGTYTVTACADGNNDGVSTNGVLTELTEGSSDNCSTANISVSSLPDLVTIDLSISVASPITGDSITFSGKVRNSGASTAGAHQARFCVDNDTCLTSTTGKVNISGDSDGDADVPSLAATTTSTSGYTTVTWTATAGPHTVYWCTDVTPADVTEADETNNCSTLAFTVNSPSAPSCSASPNPVVKNNTVTLTASGGSSGSYSWSNTLPNGSATIGGSISGTYTTTGTKNVTVTRNGVNGYCTVEVTEPGAAPDLDAIYVKIVNPTDSCHTSTSLTQVVTYTNYKLCGNVWNTGNAPTARDSYSRFCYGTANCFSVPNQTVGSDHLVANLAVFYESGPQDSAAFQFVVGGSITIHYCADISYQVAESNESNNCESLLITVREFDYSLNKDSDITIVRPNPGYTSTGRNWITATSTTTDVGGNVSLSQSTPRSGMSLTTPTWSCYVPGSNISPYMCSIENVVHIDDSVPAGTYGITVTGTPRNRTVTYTVTVIDGFKYEPTFSAQRTSGGVPVSPGQPPRYRVRPGAEFDLVGLVPNIGTANPPDTRVRIYSYDGTGIFTADKSTCQASVAVSPAPSCTGVSYEGIWQINPGSKMGTSYPNSFKITFDFPTTRTSGTYNFRLLIEPAEGYSNGTIIRNSVEKELVIVIDDPHTPYVATSDGDVHAGGGIGAYCSNYSNNVRGRVGAVAGSVGSYVVSSTGTVTDFGSSGNKLGNTLTFGVPTGDEYLKVCRPNLAAAASAFEQLYGSARVVTATNTAAVLNALEDASNQGKLIKYTGSSNLTLGTIAIAKRVTLWAPNANVIINGNITYAASSSFSRTTAPGFGVIVGTGTTPLTASGNIKVSYNSSQLSGYYFATGYIDTSYDNLNIRNFLNVDGLLMGNTLRLGRLGGSADARVGESSVAAEQINFSKLLYIAPPPVFDNFTSTPNFQGERPPIY